MKGLHQETLAQWLLFFREESRTKAYEHRSRDPWIPVI
jgi:hypothetical protein